MPDTAILEGFGVDDLDAGSLSSYRNLFHSTKPYHPWLQRDDRGLLEMLGGYRKDRSTGVEGVTLAGMLMFGQFRPLHDAVPNYLVDYQERDATQPDVRYLDRLTTDGTWSGNLFDFYRQVYARLVRDLKVPFAYREGTQRVDQTPLHEAVREGLTNCLIHADHRGRVGILVTRSPRGFQFRNPGGLRLPLELVLAGGTSDCRNRNLQKMFQMIGAGEQAGSGLPRILSAWREQRWRTPMLREAREPDHTLLELPMLSLMPEEAIQHLDRRFGRAFRGLEEPQRLALATAAVEGRVNNTRLRELIDLHPRDVTLMFEELVRRELLDPHDTRRNKYYTLPGARGGERSLGPLFDRDVDSLGAKSAPSPRQVQLLEFAREPRTMQELMAHMGAPTRTTFRVKFVQPLLDAELLAMTVPDRPRSSKQRYVSTDRGRTAAAEVEGDADEP